VIDGRWKEVGRGSAAARRWRAKKGAWSGGRWGPVAAAGIRRRHDGCPGN
jgi:hypothetical protein